MLAKIWVSACLKKQNKKKTCVMFTTPADMGQRCTNISSSSQNSEREKKSREGAGRKCSFPEVRATKIERGTALHAQTLFLHAKQQHSFYESCCGWVCLANDWTSLKYLHPLPSSKNRQYVFRSTWHKYHAATENEYRGVLVPFGVLSQWHRVLLWSVFWLVVMQPVCEILSHVIPQWHCLQGVSMLHGQTLFFKHQRRRLNLTRDWAHEK